MSKIIKFETDINQRKTSIEWWNSLTEEDRKAWLEQFEVTILTGQAIQQMYSSQEDVVIEKVYTKSEILVIIDDYENNGIGEDYKEFKQYLIDNL